MLTDYLRRVSIYYHRWGASVILFPGRRAGVWKMASSFLWHTQKIDSVAHELRTDPEQGLSSKEAASRLATYGLNELPGIDHIPWVSIFLRQQISLMTPVLALASILLISARMLSGAFALIGVLTLTAIRVIHRHIKTPAGSPCPLPVV